MIRQNMRGNGKMESWFLVKSRIVFSNTKGYLLKG